MKTIYSIVNGYNKNLQLYPFYETHDLAKIALKKIRDARRFQPGVEVTIDTATKFQFVLGWEEAEVTFEIVPIVVQTE